MGKDYNATYQGHRIFNMVRDQQTALILDTTFRMDDLTKWSNPSLYFIETDYSVEDAVEGVSGSNAAYIGAYAGMCACFYLMVSVLVLCSNLFFKVVKKENSRESLKIVIRVISIVQYLFVSYLAVPFFTLLFQAFNCEEDPVLQYTQ